MDKCKCGHSEMEHTCPFKEIAECLVDGCNCEQFIPFNFVRKYDLRLKDVFNKLK